MEPLATRSANAVPKAKPASRKEVARQEDKAELDRKEQRARIHPEDPPRYVQEPNGPDGQEGQKYAVEGYLGAGGFAKCWQAELRDKRTRKTGERVALKVVRADMGSKKMREKFRSELQVHSKMHHPNIVDFHRSFTYGDNTYVVLELCENRSLMEMVKARKYLTGPEVRAFTIQTAGAIKYMHSKNVIHRDLKMGNIFLDANMNIKVGDFGLAALLYSPEGRRTTICGTPNYIAPEILEKSRNGHNFEVDLWSLGIIIYAMLVGTPPFQANTQEDIYKKVRLRDYDWPSPERRVIPDEAKDLVASLLVEAGNRLTPDDIVEHDFFVHGYFLDEVRPEYRYSRPDLPLRPPQQGSENIQKYLECCRKAGVGKDNKGRHWPCVGTDGGKEIIAEIQEEDLKGLAPIPGSPSVYRGSRPGTKFPTSRDAVPTAAATARQQSSFPKTISVPTLPDVYNKPLRPKMSRAAELRELNRPSAAAPPKSIMKDVPNRNELLQAPPQRPSTAAATATAPSQGLLESARRRPSPKDTIDRPEHQRSDRPLTRSVTASAALARPPGATVMQGASVSRSASTSDSTAKPRHEVDSQVRVAADVKVKAAAKPRLEPAAGMKPRSAANTKTSAATKPHPEPLSEMESKPAAGAKTKITAKPILDPPVEPEPKPRYERKAKTTAKPKFEILEETDSKPTADAKMKTLVKSRSQYQLERKARPEEMEAGDRQPIRGRRVVASATAQDSKSDSPKTGDRALGSDEALGVSRQPTTKVETKQSTRLALRQQTRPVSPRDDRERLPKTLPDEAVKGCIALYDNLRKAMGYEDCGDQFDQVKPQTETPNYVVKWVDYSTKFGVGYILKDGTIGCLFNENRDSPTGIIVRAAERHVTGGTCADYTNRYQIIPPAGYPVEFLENDGDNGILRAFVNPREYNIKLGEDGRAEKFGLGKDHFDDLRRKDVMLWRKFANYMCETLGKTDPEKYSKPTVKPADTIVTFYQRFGDVGVWGYGDGSFQFNFPDHTKIHLSNNGLHCYFLHLPSRAAEALAKFGTPVPSDVLTGRCVLSYPTHIMFRGRAGGKDFSNVMEANHFRSKMQFALEVILEWILLDGVGRGFEDPDKELKQWAGPRERRVGKGGSPTKLVWVTIGARGRDLPALETST
ncbi:MAG: Cell cycle serine/threonine-protein kinase cdc5/MSD2 [Geoglossum umbratile]|nr:MAG: Cell cycle serine/threonine-protein kinase cdc5/MSD2 [Geoglossum umbratile]